MIEEKISGIMDEINSSPEGPRAGYTIPVLVGIIGGFFTVILPVMISAVFDLSPGNFQYCGFFFRTNEVKLFLIVLTGSVFLGFASVGILCNRVRKITGAVRTGIISGVSTVLVVLLNILARNSIPPFVHIQLQDFFSIFLPILIFIIGCQVIGAVGGYFWFRRHSEFSNPSHPVCLEQIILKPAIVTLVVLVLIIGIPAAYSHVVPKPDPQKCSMSEESVNIERLDEETLKITQLRANSPADCLSDKPYINKISLDGKDVSDMTIIQQQGLEITIDPPEGLIYANGSTAVLKGPMVSNEAHTPLLQIMKYMQQKDGTLTGLRSLAYGSF